MSLARRSTQARLLITLLLLIGYVAALRASEPIHVYYRSARKSLADAPICAGIPLAYFVPAAPELCEGGYFVGQYLDCQPTDDLKE